MCTKCSSNYYLDSNYVCQSLPSNCNSADKYGACNECDDGYSVNSDGVCESEDIDICSLFTYLDKYGKETWKNCWTCTKVCSKCPSGYYMNKNSKCKKMPKNCA